MNFVAIDFETANSNRYSACSIALVVIKKNKVSNIYHSLIKPPDNNFNYINTSIHGITYNDVKNMPYFHKLWPDLKEIIGDSILVAHNASFDISVLRSCIGYYGINSPRLGYICTCELSRKIWPGQFSYKLNNICNYLDIDLNHHEALSDANACASIAIKAGRITKLKTINDLVNSSCIKCGYM